MTPPDFIEATDENGRPVLVCRGEVAALRDAERNIGNLHCVVILKSGATIGLCTTFATAVKRLAEDAE